MQEIRIMMAALLIAITATRATTPVKPEGSATNSYSAPSSVLGQDERRKEIWMGDVLVDDDTLRYNGYVVQIKHRTVMDDSPGTTRTQPRWIDVSYAVLKLKRNVLIKFDDDIYFGMGNSTSFGLLSFLHSKTKQLVVSQDVFRGGTQWVVDLSRRPRIIFDGPEWHVGREGDDMRIMDLDGDGVLEINVPMCDFYGFESLSPAATPLPAIIFKYSNKARKYLPANPNFESYLLADIEEQKRAMSQPGDVVENMNHLGATLSIVLDYIFAGREKEAWTFYDRAYKLPNKNRIKRQIRNRISTSPVYRFIYSKKVRHRST